MLLGDDIGWNEVRQNQDVDVKKRPIYNDVTFYIKVSWHNPHFVTPNLEVNNFISLKDYQDFRYRNLKMRGCC